MRLHVTQRAERHLRSLAEYIARDNPKAALAVIDVLERCFEMLLEHPELGVSAPKRTIRKFNVPKLPYVIVYQAHTEVIEIVSVFHTSRRWQELI